MAQLLRPSSAAPRATSRQRPATSGTALDCSRHPDGDRRLPAHEINLPQLKVVIYPPCPEAEPRWKYSKGRDGHGGHTSGQSPGPRRGEVRRPGEKSCCRNGKEWHQRQSVARRDKEKSHGDPVSPEEREEAQGASRSRRTRHGSRRHKPRYRQVGGS